MWPIRGCWGILRLGWSHIITDMSWIKLNQGFAGIEVNLHEKWVYIFLICEFNSLSADPESAKQTGTVQVTKHRKFQNKTAAFTDQHTVGLWSLNCCFFNLGRLTRKTAMDYRNIFLFFSPCVSPCVLWLEEPVAIAMVLQAELVSLWLPAFCLAGWSHLSCSIMAAIYDELGPCLFPARQNQTY